MSSTMTDLSPTQRSELIGVQDRLGDWLGVQVPLDGLVALEKGDRVRLVELCKALLEPADGPQVPSPDQRAAAEAFAAGVERLPAATARLKREQELLAAYTRELGFLPSPPEVLVFRSASKDATLDSLRGQLAKVAPQWRTGAADASWASLGKGEPEELEQLVERALGEPGFFRTRRGERASGLQIGMLSRRAQDGAPQRALMPEGWVAVAPGVLDDVHRGALQPLDLSVLLVFMLTLQARRVHPGRERDARFDGDTLIVADRGRALLVDWDPRARDMIDRPIAMTFDAAMRRLDECGWLAIEKAGTALRVRFGARLTAGDNA